MQGQMFVRLYKRIIIIWQVCFEHYGTVVPLPLYMIRFITWSLNFILIMSFTWDPPTQNCTKISPSDQMNSVTWIIFQYAKTCKSKWGLIFQNVQEPRHFQNLIIRLPKLSLTDF